MKNHMKFIKTKKTSSFLVFAIIIALFPLFPVMALEGEASYRPAESNIAVKYWVSATASSNADDARLAIDGNPNTAWIATSAFASLTVDLSGTYDALRKTEIVFAGSNSVYKYKLEGSTDGVAWFMLADRSNNTRVAGGFTDIFSKSGIRYLKITISSGSPIGIKDFKIINYLRPDMDNGSDIGGLQIGPFFYNANNNPPQMLPDGSRYFRGGTANPESMNNGNNFYGLVKDMGWHTTRIRIWNLPRREGDSNKTAELGDTPEGNVDGGSSPNYTRNHAKYIVGAGQNLAIDFHYADSWSDPQNQPKPYEWAELPFESVNPEQNDLIKATYSFTYEMIKSLIDQGTPPSIVAIGNEISNGMMWGREYELTNPFCDYHDYYRRFIRDNPNAPLGGGIEWVNYENARDDKNSSEYKSFLASIVRLAKLVDAGQRAIKKLNEEYRLNMQTEMHFAFNVCEGLPKAAHDPNEVLKKVITLVGGLAENLKNMSGMTDRVGLSYYPDWHGTYGIMQKNIVELSKIIPGVKFNIAECSPRYSGTVSDWMNNPNLIRNPWNDDPALGSSFTYSAQWQGDDTKNIMMLINDIPDNLGMGVWPWNGQSVYFAGGEPRASFLVWNDAFAIAVVESSVYVTTTVGKSATLPTTVKNLNVATGVITDVAVTWDSALFSTAGVFEIKGIASATGNMNEVAAYITVVEPSMP